MKNHIFQIFHSAETRAELDEGFIPLDNAGQPLDWFEYWPIRRFLIGNRVDAQVGYGFLSSQFVEKTQLKSEQVKQFIDGMPEDVDVVAFTPGFADAAFFKNVFEQAQRVHPDVAAAMRGVISILAPGQDGQTVLDGLLMSSAQTVFANYLVARPAFWDAWLKNCEVVFQLAQRTDSELGRLLNAAVPYGEGHVPAKVFVIEVLASFMLAMSPSQWKVRHFNSMQLPASDMRNGNGNIVVRREELIALDALKLAAVNTGVIEYFSEYERRRRDLGGKLDARATPWPDLFGFKMQPQGGRVALVLHIEGDIAWQDLEDSFASVAVPFDLFVGLAPDVPPEMEAAIAARMPAARVLRLTRGGGDIPWLMTLLNGGLPFLYDVIGKIRVRRGEDPNAWRHAAREAGLGVGGALEKIVDAFGADPDLGIVVARGHRYGDDDAHWGKARQRVFELGAPAGIDRIPEGAAFPGGPVYWIRPFILRSIAALGLMPNDFDPDIWPDNATTGEQVERLIGLACSDAAMRVDSLDDLPAVSGALETASPKQDGELNIQAIAYYLPQYHPTEENDKWWGAGFTEWSNVTRAKPLYRNHRQPRLPADLGFYDLRMPEVRERQVALAREYGISAFCYYYYWFDGKRVLHRPLDEVLASGKPDFPFMLCWANEPWSRNWDGGNREVLMPQTYSPGWVEKFAADIAPLLRDPRYFRFRGKPVLLIYRLLHIPDTLKAVRTLRRALAKLGVGEIYLCANYTGFPDEVGYTQNPADLGLDHYVGFPPHHTPSFRMNDAVTDLHPDFEGNVFNYEMTVQAMLALYTGSDGAIHPAVMMGWDNTARRVMRANSFHGATPAKFRRWMRKLIAHQRTKRRQSGELLFINAWNEWAEGTYLEPDRDFGHGWLEAVASAQGRTRE